MKSKTSPQFIKVAEETGSLDWLAGYPAHDNPWQGYALRLAWARGWGKAQYCNSVMWGEDEPIMFWKDKK